MANSIDALIEFLVEEISENPQGLSVTEIATSTTNFYTDPEADAGPGSTSATAALHKVTVDKAFLAQVWSRLAKHPDLSIDGDAQLDEILLAQVEAEINKPSIEDQPDAPDSPRATPGKLTRSRKALTPEVPRVYLRHKRRATEQDTVSLDVRDDPPSALRTSTRARRPRPNFEALLTPHRGTKRKRPLDDDEEAVKGRPRKYLRGTEKFWRLQFKKARQIAGQDEADVEAVNLKEPISKALYAGRPAEFDQTLVEALEARLPVPISPDDIKEDWINLSRKVLDRSSDGVYMSPMGVRWDSFKSLSRVMVVKTPRLATVDFNERGETHSWQFISSSASHSFAYRRYYPKLPAKAPRFVRGPPRMRRTAETESHENDEKKKAGPRLGMFYEETAFGETPPVSIQQTMTDDAHVNLTMDSTDDDQGHPHHEIAGTGPSLPTSVVETVGTQEKEAAPSARRPRRRSNASLASGPPAEITAPAIRSSRKRKLTEKALQFLESSESRNTRLFSETRSIGSEESPAAQVVDGVRDFDKNLTLLSGIEAAAASRSHSVAAQPIVAATHPEATDDATQSNTLQTKPASTNRTPATRKRRADSAELGDQQTPAKRKYKKGANALCRKIVLELVNETSGVAPNDHSTLRRIAATRWQEAGEKDKPLLQTIKAAIKSLTASGNLKATTFMFRGKSGTMVTRSVLFLPTINLSSHLVEDAKKKIKDVDPTDYIPAQWEAEAARTPLLNKDPPSMTEQMDDDKPSPRRQRAPSSEIPERPTKRRRASSAASDGTIDLINGNNTRSQSAPTTDPPPETTAIGFLTLKVPALSSVPAVALEARRAQCPVRGLLVDASYANPWRNETIGVKQRRRKKRNVESEPPGQSIVWRNFPASIDDILEFPNLKLNFSQCLTADTAVLGQDWQYFACQVEGVRCWEEVDSEAALSKRSHYGFINHIVPEALYFRVEIPSTVLFESLVYFNQQGKELQGAYPPTESWPTFTAALQAAPEEASQIAGGRGVVLQVLPPPPPPDASTANLRRTSRVPKPTKKADNVFFDPALEEALAPVPNRQIIADNDLDDPAFEVELESSPKRQRKAPASTKKTPKTAGASASKRIYRPRAKRTTPPSGLTQGEAWTQKMPEDRLRRLVVSVVVIRTLAGGMEGDIEWSLLLPLFPRHREIYLKSSWETLSSRRSAELQTLTEEFQDKYLDALEAGEAPSVDLADLKANDWPAVIEWALKNLNHVNLKELAVPADFEEVDLADGRDGFLDDYDVAFEEPKRYHNVGAHPLAPVRDDAVRSSIFGIPNSSATALQHRPRVVTALNNPSLRLAKSYALASIMTPESVFNSVLAHAKLSTIAPDPKISERLLGEALTLLESENLVQRRPLKRSSQPAAAESSGLRVWEAHPSFISRFQSLGLVSPSILRRAVDFKREVLDTAFREGDVSFFEKDGNVSDGEILVILDLIAKGQVRCKPGPDVPRTRYGLDHEKAGYRTRLIDRRSLGFGVELHPTKAYVYGDMIAKYCNTPVPRGQAEQDGGIIPAWIDIHGNVNTQLWETFLAGVVGLVNQMPGISAGDVSQTFGHSLEREDVEMVLAWAEQGGFVLKDPKTGGCNTGEWWWMCIDGGNDGEA